MTAIEQSIEEIDMKIREVSRTANVHKLEGLVIAKYILIGHLDKKEPIEENANTDIS